MRFQVEDANLVFSPDIGTGPSKQFLLQSKSEGMSVWKIKRCGQELKLSREQGSNPEVCKSLRHYVTATWHHPNVLYIIDKGGFLIRVRKLPDYVVR